MTYIMLKSTADISTLVPVEQKALALKEALTALLNGDTLVIRGYETTTNGDVFVHLNLELAVPVTEISNTSPANGAVWTKYPVPVNAFALYPIYEYDATLYKSMVFQTGDTVNYKDDKVHMVGLVNAVFQDADHNLYYQINGDLYTVAAVADTVVTDSNISGMDVRQPVADLTSDYHTIDVSDYQDKVYVLF